jgi:preprotein translocase subunit SecG
MNILFGIIFGIYTVLCLLLILIILMQKGKSSMGFGHMGGASQLLFGGSGGQDFLQKVTWTLGMLFMFGSLGLAIVKSRHSKQSRFIPTAIASTPAPVETAENTATPKQ